VDIGAFNHTQRLPSIFWASDFDVNTYYFAQCYSSHDSKQSMRVTVINIGLYSREIVSDVVTRELGIATVENENSYN
jgi:hypothetical protein